MPNSHFPLMINTRQSLRINIAYKRASILGAISHIRGLGVLFFQGERD